MFLKKLKDLRLTYHYPKTYFNQENKLKNQNSF